MSDTGIKIVPGADPDIGLTLKIPHTDEGKAFLGKLQELLGGKELPFATAAEAKPGTLGTVSAAAEPAGTSASSTPQKFALNMRLEQEGWPPKPTGT